METIIFFSFFQHCTHKVLTNHREKEKKKRSECVSVAGEEKKKEKGKDERRLCETAACLFTLLEK